MNDIIILLKSSDFIAHDLTQCYAECIGTPAHATHYNLVLKEYVSVNPAMEYRVFVRGNNIVGISQRDVYTYYPFLANEADNAKQRIVAFFALNLRDTFPLNECNHYYILLIERCL